MEYRKLKGTDLNVSVLTFGTATFGGTHGFEGWGHTDKKDAKKLVDICLDSGINMFDTADVYSRGLSEEILGYAISGNRQDILLSTKGGFEMEDNVKSPRITREHIIKSCEDSLKRLGTDYIDLYYVHGFDANINVEETLRALDDLVMSGKVRYVGCSNFSGWHLMKSLSESEKYGLSRYVAQQVYYSLLNRDFEWELMPLGIDQNVSSIIWSPLAAGRLAGRYRRNEPIPSDGRVANNGAPVRDNIVSYEVLYDIVDELEKISKEIGKTVAQIALNWLLSRPTVCSLVIGAKKEQHLKQNIDSVGWSLTNEQIERLDKISRQPKPYPYWHQDLKPYLNAQLFD